VRAVCRGCAGVVTADVILTGWRLKSGPQPIGVRVGDTLGDQLVAMLASVSDAPLGDSPGGSWNIETTDRRVRTA
jgi:hypothetical protein